MPRKIDIPAKSAKRQKPPPADIASRRKWLRGHNEHEDTELFKRLHEENEHDVSVRKARWASLKEEWLERNLTGRMVHWQTLGPKYGIRAQTGMQKCANEKWYDEIDIRAKAREDIIDKAMVERHLAIMGRLEEDFMTSEEAIRKRHAVFCRSLQEKAMEGLRMRPLAHFKPGELIRLLELSIVEERRAMGMKETADLPAPPGQEELVREGYRSIFDQLGGHQKVQQIGTLLLKELQRTGGVIDIKASVQSVQSTATGVDTGIPASGAQDVQDVDAKYQPVPEPRKPPKFVIRVGPKAVPA